MATQGEKKAKLAQTKIPKMMTPSKYWAYLENLKLEGKPHCMID